MGIYLCDPSKNKSCRKTGCHIYGGECYMTTSEKNRFCLKVKLDDFAIEPTRAHAADAGLDLFSPVDKWIFRGTIEMIDTGVHVQIPEGFAGLLTSKSGLMLDGITTRGTIDSGYTGSIKAVIQNDGAESYLIRKGQGITQLVLVKCITPEIEIVEELEETERGDNGFGSSGR